MVRVANSWYSKWVCAISNEGGRRRGVASCRCFQRHPSRHPWNSCVPRRRINTHTPIPPKRFLRSCPFFLSFLALSSSSIVPVSPFPSLPRCRLSYYISLPPEHHPPRLSRGFTRLTVYFRVYKQDLWRQFTLKLVELVELNVTTSFPLGWLRTN